MDKLPFEIFICIIELLDHESRLNCCQVCKKWNNNLNQSYLLFESVFCNDLNNYNRLKQYFKQNKHLSDRVETFVYSLKGELSVDHLNQLPPIIPSIKHFRLFTNDSTIYTHVNSKGRRIAPRTARFVDQTGIRRGVYEGHMNETFKGWSSTLESIEDTSTNMLSAFMLNCSTQPFKHLRRLWLNYSNIVESKLVSGMNYSLKGLKQAPALEEITLRYTYVSFADLDILHQHCQQLHSLRLEFADIANHPSAPGQRFIYDIPPLHYEPTEAPNLKSLDIVSSHIGSGAPILHYIAVKYKHAERIICNVSNIIQRSMSDTYREQAVVLLLSCAKLKQFDCNLFAITPSILRLMDSQGIDKIQKFTIGLSDDTENFVVLCTSDNYKLELKDLTMKIGIYPNHFNDILLNLRNLTRLQLINFGYPTIGASSEFEEEGYGYEEATMLPFDVLLSGLEHLEIVELQGFFISMNNVEKTQHNVKEISINECTFESFLNEEDGTLFSICNYISACCLQLQLLSLNGYWNYDPQESEVNLKLFDHTQLTRIEVFIMYSCPYIRHIDEEGAETWFEIQRNEQDYQGFTYVPVSEELPSHVKENNQYFTIECKDSKIFYAEKVYYQEPFLF